MKLRAVMAAYGDGDKPIWHTETGFYTGPVGLSEAEQAARIVRYSVGLLALGIERTFQLTLADWTDDPQHHDLSVYRGLTHADYQPKPSYAAYQTMCRRLGDKEFVAAIRPAPGVSGYLFENEGETVLVLWRTAAGLPSPVSLALGRPVVLVQKLGGAWQIRREETGEYELSVGSDPVYVLNPGKPITAQRAVRWPNPVLTQIPRARDAAIEATVANTTSEPLVLWLYPHRYAPVRFESREIAPGTTERVSVAVNAAQLDVGRHEFLWQLSRRGVDRAFAEGFRLVEVTSPIDLAFGALRELRPARPVLPVRVAYRGDNAATGRLTLDVDGKPVGKPLDVELTPQAENRYDLAFDLSPFAERRPVPVAVTLETLGLKLTTGCRRPLIPCRRAPQNATVDGDLGEWRDHEPLIRPDMMHWEHVNARQPPPPEDLSVSAWIAHDDRGLWLGVEATDDRLAFPQSRAVWNWDSLQVGLDLAADGEPGAGYDDDDLEIELGRKPDGSVWCYLGACPAGWPQDELSAKLRGAVRADEGRGVVYYELLVPAELLVAMTELRADTVMGFSILVNDNDGGGRAGWLELTPGIGWGKEPDKFAWLWLR
jgi:hypothetical protein